MIDTLKPDDLLKAGKWHEVTAEIAGIIPPGELTCESGRRIDKPALQFEGKRKILFVSDTLKRTLHYVTGSPFGQETIGCTVRLGVRVVPAFGGLSLTIRVIPPPDLILPRSLVEAIGTVPKPIKQPQRSQPSSQTPQEPR